MQDKRTPEESSPNWKRPTWEFLEGPYFWGGIGVVLGAMATSPIWFGRAFVAAGVAIGVGLWRANFFYKNRSSVVRFFLRLGLCGVFGLAWAMLWGKIPKPEAPITRATVREEVRAALSDNNSGRQPTSIQQPMKEDAPISKSDISSIIRDEINRSRIQNGELDRDLCGASNADLRQRANAIISSLHSEQESLQQAETLADVPNHPDKVERYHKLKALVDNLNNDSANRKLFANANHLYDCVLIRLNERPATQALFGPVDVFGGAKGFYFAIGDLEEKIKRLPMR